MAHSAAFDLPQQCACDGSHYVSAREAAASASWRHRQQGLLFDPDAVATSGWFSATPAGWGYSGGNGCAYHWGKRTRTGLPTIPARHGSGVVITLLVTYDDYSPYGASLEVAIDGVPAGPLCTDLPPTRLYVCTGQSRCRQHVVTLVTRAVCWLQVPCGGLVRCWRPCPVHGSQAKPTVPTCSYFPATAPRHAFGWRKSGLHGGSVQTQQRLWQGGCHV